MASNKTRKRVQWKTVWKNKFSTCPEINCNHFQVLIKLALNEFKLLVVACCFGALCAHVLLSSYMQHTKLPTRRKNTLCIQFQHGIVVRASAPAPPNPLRRLKVPDKFLSLFIASTPSC